MSYSRGSDSSPPKNNKNPVRWVVVQLTSKGESEKDLAALKFAATRILRQEVEVFIPAISRQVREETKTAFYISGYIFIKHIEGLSYSRLQDTNYFKSVLTRGSTYYLVDDSELNPTRQGMKTMKVSLFRTGQSVKIAHGTFKNLPGKILILRDNDEVAGVIVDLRSKHLVIEFPTTYLEDATP